MRSLRARAKDLLDVLPLVVRRARDLPLLIVGPRPDTTFPC